MCGRVIQKSRPDRLSLSIVDDRSPDLRAARAGPTGRRATTAPLGGCFGTSDRFWMHLQATYEVIEARQAIGAELDEIEPLSRETA
jgi:hypothetical protein